MDLDRFDRQLLNLVQEDSGQTAERLAEQVELSPSAIQRRLRRMRDEGVIVRDCAIVDPAVVGRPDFFVVALQVERERADLLAQLRKWLTAEPQIQQAFYVTGEADFTRHRKTRVNPSGAAMQRKSRDFVTAIPFGS
jgi:DNA-binding Lrp family transcriptional regulator